MDNYFSETNPNTIFSDEITYPMSETLNHSLGLLPARINSINQELNKKNWLINDFDDRPYFIKEKKISLILETQSQLHLKQIIDLSNSGNTKNIRFDRFGSLNLNISQRMHQFYSKVYPEIKINRLLFKSNNFFKLTDKRSKLMINDNDGKSFYVKDLRSGRISEYSLSLLSHYFVNTNTEPRLLKKHLRDNYLYLFFKNKAIVCDIHYAKVLKIAFYSGNKIFISQDERFFMVKNEPTYSIYMMDTLDYILSCQFDRRITKFDVRNRINGYWLLFLLDMRGVLYINGFNCACGKLKRILGLKNVIDFLVTSDSLFVLMANNLVQYNF